MRAGIDFLSAFDSDNFTSRRSNTVSAGNGHDPESLLSGAEQAQGFTFTNSSRVWRNEAHYLSAVSGELSTAAILDSAPRRLKAYPDYVQTLRTCRELAAESRRASAKTRPDFSGVCSECWALDRLRDAQGSRTHGAVVTGLALGFGLF